MVRAPPREFSRKLSLREDNAQCVHPLANSQIHHFRLWLREDHADFPRALFICRSNLLQVVDVRIKPHFLKEIVFRHV